MPRYDRGVPAIQQLDLYNRRAHRDGNMYARMIGAWRFSNPRVDYGNNRTDGVRPHMENWSPAAGSPYA
jgi:hypothetical protein